MTYYYTGGNVEVKDSLGFIRRSSVVEVGNQQLTLTREVSRLQTKNAFFSLISRLSSFFGVFSSAFSTNLVVKNFADSRDESCHNPAT